VDCLERYLEKGGIWHKFILKRETIHTKDAAEVTGIELHRISKNLACRTGEGEHVLLIIPGDRKANLSAAAEILNVKDLSLLPLKEAEAVTGYSPGGTPSIGHKLKMRVVLDRCLLEFETFFCGGGSRDRLLELRTEDVRKRTGAVIGEICSADRTFPT